MSEGQEIGTDREYEQIQKPQASSSKTRKVYVLGVAFVAVLLLGTSFGMMLSATTPSTPTVIEPGSMNTGYDYIIFEDGGNFYARNGTNGHIDFSSPTSSELMNLVIAQMGPEGGIVFLTMTHEAIDLRSIHQTNGTAVTVNAYQVQTMLEYTGAGQVVYFWFTIHDDTVVDDYINFQMNGGGWTSVDFGTLFMTHYMAPRVDGNCETYTSFDSTHLGGNLNTTDHYGGGWMSYPINFQTSIKITFQAQGTPASIYWTIYYRELKYNAITTHMVAMPLIASYHADENVTTYMFNTTGHGGRFLGINLVLSCPTGLSFLENNPTMVPDGRTLMATGTEDFFFSSWYYKNQDYSSVNNVGPNGGLVVYNPFILVSTQFRDFLAEQGGIPFHNSFQFYLPNNESNHIVSMAYWLIWEEFDI